MSTSSPIPNPEMSPISDIGVGSTTFTNTFTNLPHPPKNLNENSNGDWIKNFFDQTDLSGTGHDKSIDQEHFYSSNSYMPHLPNFSGVMGTAGTYRFMTVQEQTMIMIGEPKHGLWRIQENGLVREYLVDGELMAGFTADEWDDLDFRNYNFSEEETFIFENSYSNFISTASWAGYKYPNDPISKQGYKNFVDLSIYHPKYRQKYENHVPIDLPQFYCTMSQGEFPHIYNTWKFVSAQKRANKFGPLGKRAGLDITENYSNAIQINHLGDANVWANIGLGKDGVDMLESVETGKPQDIKFRPVNPKLDDIEIYMVERPFFNVPHLFVTVVIDNKGPIEDSTFSYIRPNGQYWEDLMVRNLLNSPFPNTEIPYTPKIKFNSKAKKAKKAIQAMPVYGHHHPDRKASGFSGGVCPQKGGDWAGYPWGDSGAAWPTNYQEIGPMCDGVSVDIKFWANLDLDWDDAYLGVGSSGFQGSKVRYTVDSNIYGNYTDKYLVDNNFINPVTINLSEGKLIQSSDTEKLPTSSFYLDFGENGKSLTYVEPKKPLGRSALERKYYEMMRVHKQKTKKMNKVIDRMQKENFELMQKVKDLENL